MNPRARLTSLIQGILAGNIFDWGAKATVDLYHNGTILEIYRYNGDSCVQCNLSFVEKIVTPAVSTLLGEGTTLCRMQAARMLPACDCVALPQTLKLRVASVALV